jgi:hypothetical protein
MGNQSSKEVQLDTSVTFRETSLLGSYDDIYTTKYTCTDKCDFSGALSDISQKYPELSSIVQGIDHHQDIIHAKQVKNIILHDQRDNLVVLQHQTPEEHKFNAFVNVHSFK